MPAPQIITAIASWTRTKLQKENENHLKCVHLISHTTVSTIGMFTLHCFYKYVYVEFLIAQDSRICQQQNICSSQKQFIYHLLSTCGHPESKDTTGSPSVHAFTNLRRHIPSKRLNLHDYQNFLIHKTDRNFEKRKRFWVLKI